MYDFILKTREELISPEAEKDFLLSVKRMMPRWCNSIPDSEFLAIYDVLNDNPLISPYFVETGSGASTLMMSWFAMRRGGKLFTWDTNGSKLYFLRSLMQDAFCRLYPEHSVWSFWRPISITSTSQFAGIQNLGELEEIKEKGIAACFLDSDHTINNLLKETEAVFTIMKNGSIILIDDSNYNSKYVNVAFANMVRKKMGLPPVAEPADNISEKNFGECVEDFLKQHTKRYRHLDDTYKTYYKNDLFWQYYQTDRDKMAEMGMEHYENLAHRFDAWEITER